ncbi:hypothetical protein JXA47_15535 [Candidatus Sumerlaeota bacterium]|nr:hypothetical protein [Candidatus Sumerlaeota bacterium]
MGLLVLTCTLASAQIAWQTTSTLPQPVRNGFLVHYEGYVYLIGGRPSGETSTTHAIDTVYYAPVNTDGSLGTWQATTSLPGNRCAHGAYAYDGTMYVWGGWDETYVTHNECYYATINGDGTLGAWTTSAVTIPDGAGQPQMDAFGQGVLGYENHIYIIGGERNDASKTDACYHCDIQSSGDYGTWQTTATMPFVDWFHGVAVHEGTAEAYLYLVGGNHSGTTESQIYISTINTDGSLGAWADSGFNLAQGTYELGCATINNFIFAVGGLSGATPLDNVGMLRVDSDTGAVTLAFETTAMPEARARTTAVCYTVNDHDYILVAGGGGYGAADPVLDSCIYSEIPRPSSVDDWSLYE